MMNVMFMCVCMCGVCACVRSRVCMRVHARECVYNDCDDKEQDISLTSIALPCWVQVIDVTFACSAGWGRRQRVQTLDKHVLTSTNHNVCIRMWLGFTSLVLPCQRSVREALCDI